MALIWVSVDITQKECAALKTQIQIVTNATGTQVTLTDAQGQKYKTVESILARLRTIRNGTRISVQNARQNTTYDAHKRYYLYFDKYGFVRLLYVNLRNGAYSVFAVTQSNKKAFERAFERAFSTLCYNLHVINGESNKKAYVINTVDNNSAVHITDDGLIKINKADMHAVEIVYKNVGGDTVTQRWMDLTEAMNYVLYKTPNSNKRYCVMSEHGTVLFLK